MRHVAHMSAWVTLMAMAKMVCLRRLMSSGVTWLVHMWDVTHSSFKCETWVTWCIQTWLIHHLCILHIQMSLMRNIHRWWMSHVWMSHVTHVSQMEWVMSHLTFEWWMSHVSHMNESRLTYEWVTSHIWMSHVTHPSAMYIPGEDDALMSSGETWLIHMWDVTHSYVRRDSFICGTWLFHNLCIGYGRWCAAELRRDMTHSDARRDSSICETWLIHMWDVTNSYVRRDSSICETTCLNENVFLENTFWYRIHVFLHCHIEYIERYILINVFYF